MNGRPAVLATVPESPQKNFWFWIAIVVVLAATAIQLHHQGRLWWCSCGWRTLWTGDAWSAHTSQYFLDPYSFTHFLHGFVLAGILLLTLRRLPVMWRLVLAIAFECTWEIFENTNFVIQRYREATASLGYQGDTVVNSLGDILCCVVGFLLARKLGWWRSIVLFLFTEAILLVWIRDSLLLEVIMLIHPIEAIKAWQIAH